MNIKLLMIVIAVAAVTGCSDKGEQGAEPGKTGLLEKTSEMSSAVGSAIEERAAATGESVGAAMDKAGQAASEAVEAVGEAGSELAASAQELAGGAQDQVAALAEQGQEQGSAAAAEAATTAAAGGAARLEPASQELDSAQLETGKAVYTGKCMACHAAGVAGAPKLGDLADWEPRVAQGLDTLSQHAINGFQGARGYMPAKGGFAALSDDEVRAAVLYMVSQLQ